MTYLVVVNDEEQHSIWPAARAVPDGWNAVTGPLPKDEALDHVTELWPDIRPLSVRRRLG